ncbi:ribosome maturation factor RimP [Micromonospora sp. CPCC 206061]|uniref:ribosome maturation factor RimP n=1 Tax=Micromonospora sp. CPCC 206061 TaxID=3122410 RepID=UPI002FEFA5CF
MTERGRTTRVPPRVSADRVRAAVEPVVAAAGYDLEEFAVSRVGRRHVVRVAIDGDGGVSLDAIADVSRAMSAALDAAEEAEGDLLPGEYELEVGSRGVSRPLSLPRHWRRNTGRLVKVTAAGRPLTGRIEEADDERVVLDVEGVRHELAYADLGPGRIEVEFTRAGADFDEDVDDEIEEDEER